MTEVEQTGRAVAQANARRDKAMARLTAAVRSAAEQGVSESELTRQAGVNRATIRKMLGKSSI